MKAEEKQNNIYPLTHLSSWVLTFIYLKTFGESILYHESKKIFGKMTWSEKIGVGRDSGVQESMGKNSTQYIDTENQWR